MNHVVWSDWLTYSLCAKSTKNTAIAFGLKYTHVTWKRNILQEFILLSMTSGIRYINPQTTMENNFA